MFTHKKLLLRALTLVVLIGTIHLAVTTGIPTAFAADNAVELQETFMTVLSMITTFMQILLLILLNMLGYLLQGDFFSDRTMMASLNQIWILSRNIMNIIFALMLIGVAFYTIITAKAEFIKSKFAQFVIAVVLVNFSWFFPRVIIDVANVLTATVYSIPNILPAATCFDFNGNVCQVIRKTKILPTPVQVKAWRTSECGGTFNTFSCACPLGIGCYAKENYPGTNMSLAHATINGMATSFIHINSLTQIPPDLLAGDGGVFENSLKIMINIMMVFVVQVAVVLPLVALGVGLFIRILILWVTIAFMPFVFLGYVINGKLGTNIFGFETDLWKEFINAAFLPAVVGIPFVIGFIMLKTAAPTPPPPGFDQEWGIPLITGVGSWWGFLWLGAAVGIIYIGAFAALRRSTITGKITDKIKAFGDTAFGTAFQLPLLTPLPLPVGTFKNAQGVDLNSNLGALLSQGQVAQDKIRIKARGSTGVAMAPGASPGFVNETNVKAKENTDNIIRAINGLSTAKFGSDQFNTNLTLLQNTVGGRDLGTVGMLTKFRDIVRNDPNGPLAAKLDTIVGIVKKAEQGPVTEPPAAPPAGKP